MKFTTFVAAAEDDDVASFQTWFNAEYRPLFASLAGAYGASVLRVSRPAPAGARTRRGNADDPAHRSWHAVHESWFPTSEDFRRTARVLEAELHGRRAHWVSYRVTPLLEKDPRFAEAGAQGRRPALTYVTPVSWLPGLPATEARRHWDEHVPIALRVHASLTKYERNWVDEVVSWSSGVVPVDAYADFSFNSLEDWERFFPDEAASLEITRDIANFIGSGSGIFLSDASPHAS